MPTITVTTTVSDTSMQRSVAKRLSRHLRAEGCDVNHVVTVFRPAKALYSGPFALSEGADAPVAVATAEVDRSRPREFGQRLAAAVVAALDHWVPANRVFVSIHPVDPAYHFVGADLLAPTESRATEVAPDTRLRLTS